MARQRKKQPSQRVDRRNDEPSKQDEGPKRGLSSRQMAIRYSEESSSTAIPPPSMLASYNNAIPDGAERIMAMAERQQAHRESLEQTVVRGDSRRSDHGLYIGGVIVALSIICATVLVALDKDVQGMGLGIASITAPLGALIWGWMRRKQEVDRLKTPQHQSQNS